MERETERGRNRQIMKEMQWNRGEGEEEKEREMKNKRVK